MQFELAIGPSRPTFGFWLNYPSGAPSDASSMLELIDSFFVGPMATFLDCMHSDCIFRTCRTSVQGSSPFSFTAVLADNHGAGTAGQSLMVASGLYVQGVTGGRGSGSRIHLPGVPNEFTTDFAYLSEYGVQQLQFAADALVNWVATGPPGPSTPCVLGTLQTRRGGTTLHPPIFDPAAVVVPTRRLETIARRQRATQGLSST
jgi:hypothetical protein